jgi:hypothetical protein
LAITLERSLFCVLQSKPDPNAIWRHFAQHVLGAGPVADPGYGIPTVIPDYLFRQDGFFFEQQRIPPAKCPNDDTFETFCDKLTAEYLCLAGWLHDFRVNMFINRCRGCIKAQR